MEISTAKWFSETGFEDPNLFHQYQMAPIDPFDDLNFQSFSSESYTPPNIGFPQPVEDVKIRPAKQLKTHHQLNHTWSSSAVSDPPKPASSSFSQIISFDNCNSPPATSTPKLEKSYLPGNYGESVRKVNSSTTRSPLHAQDHVLAERKRREKLSQRFIALSTLLPGLKKTDKASILGDAIKHLKQMHERVQALEEQVARKTVETVVLVNKTQIYADDDRTSSSDENFDANSKQQLPEIEAKVSGRDLLIRIHCEKTKGCIGSIMSEIERLHLSVLSSNVLPFGAATLDITVLAKMEAEFTVTAKDLVKNLRQALFCPERQ